MDAIGVENLRSLADTGLIQLRPITLLVGQNSSGKSTFLRILTLLKQSVEQRTSGPILWYGDYVDFGDFETALSKPTSKESIGFRFQFPLHQRDLFLTAPRITEKDLAKYPEEIDFVVSIQIVKSKEPEGGSQVAECCIEYADHKATINIDNQGSISRFQINGSDLSVYGQQYHSRRREALIVSFVEERAENDSAPYERRRSSLSTALEKELEKYLPRNVADYTIRLIAEDIHVGSSAQMLQSLQDPKYLSDRSLSTIQNWTIDDRRFQTIRDLHVAQTLLTLLPSLNSYVTEFARNSKYIGPVRATVARYNRVQDLAVNEVDFEGQNIAVFLRSLTRSERDSFADFTRNYLGFESKANAESSQISLTLKEVGSGKEFNMADMGFGYTQILPIAAQLWSFTNKRKSSSVNRPRQRTPIVFAIEQPELHLHPRLQAKLSDAFFASIKAAAEVGLDLRLLVETHSETIVNRFGHLIARKTVKPDDVNVVLFDKSPSNGSTKIRVSRYDQEGILTNWPFGFFGPNEE